MDISMDSFFDEMQKIAAAKEVGKKGLEALKAHWKLPTVAAGGAATYGLGGRVKRRYDIGKAVEEQQERMRGD